MKRVVNHTVNNVLPVVLNELIDVLESKMRSRSKPRRSSDSFVLVTDEAAEFEGLEWEYEEATAVGCESFDVIGEDAKESFEVCRPDEEVQPSLVDESTSSPTCRVETEGAREPGKCV